MATVPFAFLPRVVSKHAKPWPGISRRSPSPSPSPDLTIDSEEEGDDDASEDESNTEPSSLNKGKGKGKGKGIEPAHSKQSTLTQDIASLISLALSDYNIWLDADLRCKLDAYLSDETSPDGTGFVPINYLLRRAPFRGSLPRVGSAQPEPSETEVVKALRTHASHILEVRMRLPLSSSVWYGTGKTSRKKDVGGYEVRRKDWPSLRDRPSHGWTRARWDDMTTYVEGMPPQYRTVGGIARFVETLLSSETNTEPRLSVQTVTLPPHYLDKPGDTPKCKGYALVTLSTKSHAEALRRAWPWKRVSDSEDASQTVKEAHKYGLRTISKARWDALNEEYFLYKQSLVDTMARTHTHTHTEMDHHPYQDATKAQAQAQDEQQQHGDEESQTRRWTTPTSPYPFDCLVFVRNVHPETNKTTLKALFGQAFQDDLGPQLGGGAGLDYVDFNKGMDTCYLRLASPHHATRLIAYVGARGIAQADGLDALGRTPVRNDKPIVAEMVQGTKEDVYWEKVPEKVRRQAVDKAVKAAGAESSASPTTYANATCGSGQKKRRREP